MGGFSATGPGQTLAYFRKGVPTLRWTEGGNAYLWSLLNSLLFRSNAQFRLELLPAPLSLRALMDGNVEVNHEWGEFVEATITGPRAYGRRRRYNCEAARRMQV
jgi:hypothetical protein